MPSKLRVLIGPALLDLAHGVGRRMSVLLGTALIAVCGGCGGGGGNDDPYHFFPSYLATDVVVTDLDGDGRNDVLTIAAFRPDATHWEGLLNVFRQMSPGRFTSESYVIGAYPWMMTVTDVDGDGTPDVAIVDVGPSDHPQPSRLWLLRQDPTQRGHLLPAQTLVETGAFDSVSITDVNGDGAPDIAIAANFLTRGENGITVMYQNRATRGTFAAPVIVSLPGRAAAVASGDINGDGRADLVVHTITSPVGVSPHTSVLSLLRQQADSTLAPAITFAPRSGLNSERLEIRDADGDGRADILHYQTPCCSTPAYLTLLSQGGIGTFRDVATQVDRPGPEYVAFGDFDGDGRVDAAGVAIGNTQVMLFRQEAGGTFRATGTIAMPASSLTGITAVDVDGDGRTDLVVVGGNIHENHAWVLLQVPGQPGSFGAPRLLP